MKVTPDLVAHIVEERANEVSALLCRESNDTELCVGAFNEVLRVVASYSTPATEVVLLATASYRALKRLLRSNDPHRKLKSLELATASKIKDELLGGEGRSLSDIVKLSALLTTLSPSLDNADVLRSLGSLSEIPLESVGAVDLSELRGKKVAFVLANIGGLPADALLIRRLTEELGCSVDVYAKTGAYSNDVTFEELEELGLLEGVRVLPVDTDAAGIDESVYPRRDLREILEHDWVVAKGLMNYCGLRELSPGNALCLLTVSKSSVARALGLKPNVPVLARV
ncbi:MAG: hypothetical protein QXU97_03035 [Fervidicoccaceae archaeon]